VLLIDEAQETKQLLLEELRLLSSSRLDSHLLLTVCLPGISVCPNASAVMSWLLWDRVSRVKLTLDRATPRSYGSAWCTHCTARGCETHDFGVIATCAITRKATCGR